MAPRYYSHINYEDAYSGEHYDTRNKKLNRKLQKTVFTTLVSDYVTETIVNEQTATSKCSKCYRNDYDYQQHSMCAHGHKIETVKPKYCNCPICEGYYTATYKGGYESKYQYPLTLGYCPHGYMLTSDSEYKICKCGKCGGKEIDKNRCKHGYQITRTNTGVTRYYYDIGGSMDTSKLSSNSVKGTHKFTADHKLETSFCIVKLSNQFYDHKDGRKFKNESCCLTYSLEPCSELTQSNTKNYNNSMIITYKLMFRNENWYLEESYKKLFKYRANDVERLARKPKGKFLQKLRHDKKTALAAIIKKVLERPRNSKKVCA